MTTTCNPGVLNEMANECFVKGSLRGNRARIARDLNRVFNFKGGYRAAYRLVGEGYTACDTYAGKLADGGYGINCWFAP